MAYSTIPADLSRPPSAPGAVRVFARAGGAEVFVTTDVHNLGAGVVQAFVRWAMSAEVALEIVDEAERRLQVLYGPSHGGWFAYPVAEMPKLIRDAAVACSAVLRRRPAALRQTWTKQRVARLGYLVGLGWDAKRIAADPFVQSTPNNIHVQAGRCGLSLRAARDEGIKVPAAIAGAYDRHARARGVTREALIVRLLTAAVDRVDLLLPQR